MDTRIQVQLWNILKYFLLTLLLAPIAECAVSRITAWRNATLVNNGKFIRLKSSALGNIALHQEVETTLVSSRIWQLCSMVLAFGIALPFEYSSGAQSQLIWCEQRSHCAPVATNVSQDMILLALDNAAQRSECVQPGRLADVGQMVFLAPTEEKPSFLRGVVTRDTIRALLDVPYQGHSWRRTALHSRSGDIGLQLYAGGRGGHQALIGNPDKRGWLVADFEHQTLCKGFLNDTFSCYDMAAQLSLSQLVYSLASVRGSSFFLRTQPNEAAKLYRFNAGFVTNSIGDPSVEENRFEQRLNESGFEWLWRLESEHELDALFVSTLELDEQLRSVDCESQGSVQIRPVGLQVGERVQGGDFVVNISTRGELMLVKAGSRFQTILLTEGGDGWKCAIDEVSGVCVSEASQELHYVTKAEGVEEYRSQYSLRVTQSFESYADLAVVQAQLLNEMFRSGFLDWWDLKNVLSFSAARLEGARSITKGMRSGVFVSCGIRVTGTIESWAVVLYGSLLVLFVAVVVLFRLKRLGGIDIEAMYQRVVWQRESALHSTEAATTAPTIGIAECTWDGAVGVTASYYDINKAPVGWRQR